MVSRQDPALSYPPPSVTHAVPLYIYVQNYKTHMHKIEITKKHTNMQKQEWSVDNRQDPVTKSLPLYILGWSLCQRINLRSKGSAL